MARVDDRFRRHFSLMFIRRNIDGMEAVKMNVFHWHLSENQGFAWRSKKYPKLHELGSDALTTRR